MHETFMNSLLAMQGFHDSPSFPISKRNSICEALQVRGGMCWRLFLSITKLEILSDNKYLFIGVGTHFHFIAFHRRSFWLVLHCEKHHLRVICSMKSMRLFFSFCSLTDFRAKQRHLVTRGNFLSFCPVLSTVHNNIVFRHIVPDGVIWGDCFPAFLFKSSSWEASG